MTIDMKVDIITEDGTRVSGEIKSFTALTSPMRFDIMVDGYYRGQIAFPCTIGEEYSLKDLKSFCKLKKPSLTDKDFDLLPTDKPRFRN
jgi:hypothetical protein